MTIRHNPPPPGLEPDVQRRADRIYQHALVLAFGPGRRPVPSNAVFNRLYWLAVMVGMSWILSMAIDRSPPVEIGPRIVMNEGGKVQQGDRLLISSTRRRHRTCELVRRVYVIDGQNRRHDFEPEEFDAYGPVTPVTEPVETETSGPFIPFDAAPGRGRSVTVLAHDCNTLQRALGWSIVTVLPTVEFEIVARSSTR
ncbi:MAG: hypothetical protein K2Y56_24185 [Methylobacterium sp.]|uniref:hypothetical protein n=1 Tax=Methylobacterium sp. TaxID=409 RepID=UPI002601198F|nr:hypothetical protein [Methylobacterium sp.]MBX9934578.1 hypothetical protein [Methylobacterium sp.]